MKRWWVALLVMAVALGGCSRSHPKPRPIDLTLATTTRVLETGVLEMLVPMFQRQSGLNVKVVSMGGGQELEFGRRGKVDVLLSHSPEADEKFVADGDGTSRRNVMRNDFVLVGPAADPAKVKETKTIADALSRIANNKATFLSRSDETCTQRKERQLWEKAKLQPTDDWHLKSPGGAKMFQMASDKGAYTLCDRGTFLKERKKLNLVILSRADPLLVNQFSVIVVNPVKHPGVHDVAAEKFAQFLLEPATQQAIARFGKDKYGEGLFTVEKEK
ncbi:MAG: substrate-binding domain-containing protein [Planctomycetia bacterium]|nr:substrate-binding domain-containing protein [Planctomycetia bacterium]